MLAACRHVLVVVLTALALTGCAAVSDAPRIEACGAVLALLEPGARVTAVEPPGLFDATVRLAYRDAQGEDLTLACTFRAGTRQDLALVLTAVEGEAFGGPVDRTRLLWLSLALGLPRDGSAFAGGGDGGGEGLLQALAPDIALPDRVLYLLAQVNNGIITACLYGLLAMGFTLVYAITGRINLALGGLYTVGAFAAGAVIAGLVMGGAWGIAGLIVLVLPTALGWGALAAWCLERTAFRRLHDVGTQAPLIASIGAALVFSEGFRVLTGARDLWPPPLFGDPYAVMEGVDLALHVSQAQPLVVALTLVVYLGLWRLLTATRLGRAQRACADDPAMARLVGIDAGRTIGVTFALAGACAGVAGMLVTVVYGGANFFMGWSIGLKALTAAVVGGIGSVPGAMLGGLVVGMTEALWTAYLPGEWRDVAVFTLLIVFLVLKPRGFLGIARQQRD